MVNPKVSVIIPVYNTEKYLRECLDSIVNQTIGEIEIICIDDGSTDRSMDILQEYADKDKRIRIFSQQNGGTGRARNTGLQQATGEYIAFLDSDDYVDSSMCESILKVALSANADIVVYGGNTFPTTLDWAEDNLTIKNCEYHDDSINALVYENGSWPFIWNKLYKRELILGNNLLFPPIPIGQDHAWLFTVFPRAKHIVYVPSRFYHYRQNRKGSTMEKFAPDRVLLLEQHKKIVEFVYNKWNESGDFDIYGHYWAHWCLTFFGVDILHTIYAQAKDIAPWIIERVKPFKNLLPDESQNILEKLQLLINDPKEFFEKQFYLKQKELEKEIKNIETRLKDTESRLETTETKLRDTETKLEDTKKKLAASKSRETALKNSVSFRIGRALTWGPRKVRKFGKSL